MAPANVDNIQKVYVTRIIVNCILEIASSKSLLANNDNAQILYITRIIYRQFS